jgi:hypothetical protein
MTVKIHCRDDGKSVSLMQHPRMVFHIILQAFIMVFSLPYNLQSRKIRKFSGMHNSFPAREDFKNQLDLDIYL